MAMFMMVQWTLVLEEPRLVNQCVVEAIPCGSKAVTVADFFEQTCPSPEATLRYPSSTLSFNCTRLNIGALLSHVRNPSEMSSTESASLKLYWKYSNAAQMGAPWNTTVPLAHIADLTNLGPDILVSVSGHEVLTIHNTSPDGATVVKDSLGKDVCSGITDDEHTNCKFQAILRIPHGRNKVCHIRSMFIGVKGQLRFNCPYITDQSKVFP
ncbi:hypothetical protein RvY_12577 [Ramazzottius varieornatus]|uniref:Uncharacterized protein n=1 Tax=Ramazzottius varieornatus TaxID=947166 RepID=A0A1D1VK09_RAMVA|nr:hypothetical protein RvY_12577 [Ramazzottius varieornatus]